uniref:Uncharacterized protein n=1 Tax=Siphoviridae sp. cttJO12 TaxID=2826492 RepID=A0A8S5R1D6_9CAUD|nr:MAG TPA: hypothetical protein [Siphoviridae sp. cttJO12]
MLWHNNIVVSIVISKRCIIDYKINVVIAFWI